MQKNSNILLTPSKLAVIDINGALSKNDVSYFSPTSFSDAHIVHISPLSPYQFDNSGSSRIQSTDVQKVIQANRHWNHEIASSLDQERLIVVELLSPSVITKCHRDIYEFQETDDTRVSSDNLSNYDFFGQAPAVTCSIGTQQAVDPSNPMLRSLYDNVLSHFDYKVRLANSSITPLLRSKDGVHITAALVNCRKDQVALILLLPPIPWDYIASSEKKAIRDEYLGELDRIYKVAYQGNSTTPPPPWVSSSEHEIPESSILQENISALSSQRDSISSQLETAKNELAESERPKSILYETGKPLENVVHDAFRLMGFHVEQYESPSASIDGILTSDECCFVVEMEGRDSNAIQKGKLSQLLVHHAEFILQDGKDSYLPLLVGNPQRLTAPSERTLDFSDHCRKISKNRGVVLVRAADLFAPMCYLRQSQDQNYALECRRVLKNTIGGDIVTFPQPPKTKE